MKRTAVFAILGIAALPLTVHGQGPRAPVARTPNQVAQELPPPEDARPDRATQTLRCRTDSNTDLAIGGCTALIQSGRLTDKELAGIFARRAELYARANDAEKAFDDINQSLLLAPGDAFLYAQRGRVAQSLNLRGEAMDSFRECLARDPGMASCESDLALLQNSAQQDNDACATGGAPDAVIEACSALIERAPSVARYFNARGVAYFAQKDIRRALEDFNAAVRLAPQDSIILTNRCNAYIQLRQYDRAIDDCDDALRARPGNTQALYARGIAKFNRDDTDGAITDFNAVLAADPPNRDALLGYRGATYLKSGNFDNAERDLTEALTVNPDSAGAHAYLGGLYVERDEPDAAIKELDTALSLNPSLAVALIYRGRAYIVKKQTTRGLRDLDEAVMLEPDNAQMFEARGEVFLELGQATKAADDFRACRVLDAFAYCGIAAPPGSGANQPPAVPTPKPQPEAPKP